MNTIDRFRGDYFFLSNFSPAEIRWVQKGLTFHAPTAEHAYQALKTRNLEQRCWVLEAPTPAVAKARGRRVPQRPDWLHLRLKAMAFVIRLKFARNSVLAQQLVATGDALLVEGNDWNDQYWGVCRGRGANTLGKMLMGRRSWLLSLADGTGRMA